MVRKSILFCCIIPFIFSSCAKDEPKIEFKQPATQVPKQQPKPRTNKGSLYSMEGSSLFADKKDLQIGDIIQINISESLSSNSENSRELSSDRSNNLGGGLLAGTNGNALGGTASGMADKFNSSLGVDFGTNSSVSDSGENKTELSEDFSTTVSAIINETYQNGNYLIRGTKEILINGQKQTVILTGVIRPYDIGSDNSISSSKIANLKLLYDKDGEDAEIMETPWGLKVIRAIWPF
ncbi:MAG: flagellar basal body L-ring protein FlgH [Campylobacterota bacterium]